MIRNVPRVPFGNDLRAQVTEGYKNLALLRDDLESTLNEIEDRLAALGTSTEKVETLIDSGGAFVYPDGDIVRY